MPRLPFYLSTLIVALSLASSCAKPTHIDCVQDDQCDPGFICDDLICIEGSRAADGGVTNDGGAQPDAGTDGGSADAGRPDSGDRVDAGRPPNPHDDRYTVTEEVESLLDVLTNDDPSGLALTAVTTSSLGVATIEGANVRFLPGCSAGAGTLEYEVRDALERTATASVQILVEDRTPPAMPGSLEVEADSIVDSVLVHFQAPGENGDGSACSVSAYEVYVGASPDMATSSTVTLSAAAAPGDEETLSLPLALGGQYYLQVAAVDDVGQRGPLTSAPTRVDLRRTADLSPSNAAADFGGVVELEAAPMSWSLENTSPIAALEIQQVSLSGSPDFQLTSPPPAGFRLAPGQRQTITVVYTPSDQSADNGTLTIDSSADDASTRLTVALTGHGLPAVTAAADIFTVEEEATTDLTVLANDSPSTGLTVFNASATLGTAGVVLGGQAVRYEAMTCAPGTDSLLYTAQDSRGRSGQGTAAIMVVDTLAPEDITTVTPNYAGVTNQVRLDFAAPGENGPGSSCAPSAYELRMAMDQAMTNPTVVTLTGPQVPGSNEQRSVSVPWGQQRYAQLVAVDEGGRTSTPQSPPIVLDARRSAALEPSGSLANIGPVALRSTSDTTFTVRNTSLLADLHVLSVALSGDPEFSLVAGSAAATLAPSAGHDVVVRFAPAARVAYSGTLSITHDGPGSPLTVVLNGTVQPNSEPAFREAFASPRIFHTGGLTMLTVEIEDVDSSLPNYDDVQSVTIDTSSLPGGSTANVMVAQSPLSATVRRYTFGPVSTAGLSAGGYVLPVHVVDAAGADRWDAVTFAVYSGTARMVGPGQTYPDMQQAIAAASNGDAIILPTGTLTGPGNRELTFGLGKNLVVGPVDGPARTTIDCAGAGRAVYLINTNQTITTVLAGIAFRNCTGGALTFTGTGPRLLDLAFDSNTGGGAADIICGDRRTVDLIQGGRLHFNGQAGTFGLVSQECLSCDFCKATTPGEIAFFGPSASTHLETIGGVIGLSNASDARITDPYSLSATSCTRLEVLQSDSPAIGLNELVIQQCQDVHIHDINSFSHDPRWWLIANNAEVTNCHAPSGSVLFAWLAANNLIVQGCQASYLIDGTGSWSSYFWLELTNSTFHNNTWSAGFVRADGTARPFQIKDSILGDSAGMMFSLSQRTNPATVDHTNLPGNFSQAQVIDPNHLLNAGNGISCAPGNIDSNLCVDAGVVAGPRGDAYLSPTSPAINAGSRSASAAGLGTRTTQANGTLDTGTVDLGWHYEP